MTVAAPLDWVAFVIVVLLTMGADVLLFGGKAHHISFREAALKSILWVVVGVAFTGYVHWRLGSEPGLSYLVAYLIEKSLSVDNLFVFLAVFSYFHVKDDYQPRVLRWGIIGAVVMRAVFIVAGISLLRAFHWTIYIFGAFLVFTGIKLGFSDDEAVKPEDNFALKLAKRFLRTTDEFDGQKFFTVKNGVRYGTRLLIVLIVIEFTDVLFAVDSVPAVLAVSNDLYIVYTSNIFAILGLRALYFVLAGMMSRFRYLDTGLAVILTFIGVKMLISSWYKIPNAVSLGVIAGVLTIAMVVSWLKPEKLEIAEARGSDAPPDPAASD